MGVSAQSQFCYQALTCHFMYSFVIVSCSVLLEHAIISELVPCEIHIRQH